MKRLFAASIVLSLSAFAGEPTAQPSAPKLEVGTSGSSSASVGLLRGSGGLGTRGLGTGSFNTKGASTTKAPKTTAPAPKTN